MSEQTAEAIETEEATAASRKKRDQKRLNRIAIRHGGVLLAAFTLWGAGDVWASESGWLLAELIALGNAVFAGVIIAYLVHEWGHFAGARMSGAVSPVLKDPQSFFMFNFRYDLNTRGQFMMMSMGGPAANWLLFIILFLTLPLNTAGQALLLATTLAIAISVSIFEIPVMNRVSYGEDPQTVVDQRVKETGTNPRNTGIVLGGLFWLLAL